MTGTKPASISEVIAHGLCIGCGLCEAIGGSRAAMQMTEVGSLRPASSDDFSQAQEALLLKACPGAHVESRQFGVGEIDPIWGEHSTMQVAWASDPKVRYEAATGGVLTALGQHLIAKRLVEFVLHVRPDPAAPMRSVWTISTTPEEVAAGTGSRYGPTAPLAGLKDALDRKVPFAIIAKPCDLNALDNLSKHEPRVDQFCKYRLAMVCGGQSRLKKSQDLLQEFEIDESDLSLFRYRGYGNPGKTRIESKGGSSFEITYLELWEDEAGWQLETRCKLCPDPLGEAADIAAADIWPGGSPSGEDEGFNGIIVRSPAGEKLVESAVGASDLTLGDSISPDQFNDFQPHQVRKKIALNARYEGMALARSPCFETRGLRLSELAKRLSVEDAETERDGTRRRVAEGRFREGPDNRD